MRSITESTQKGDLSGVQERIWPRIGPNADVEAYDGTYASELIDAHCPQRSSLDAADLGRRHPTCLPDFLEGLALRSPRSSHLRSGAQPIGGGEAAAAVDRAFAGAHRRSLPASTYHALTEA
jgi:hypothetical protein